MRARNLKPSFFKNELLATSDPLHSLIFSGLWCLADREGRLEDRPRRIHLEINAGRAYEGTEQALGWLEENKFIERYEHQGTRYIQVLNFKKHQHPHVKEPASTIPAPDKHQTSPVPARLIPSSLIPDSGFMIPDSPTAAPQPINPPEFAEFQAIYPSRSGSQPWSRALKAINARVKEGYSWDEITEGARRYAAFIKATQKEGTEFVLQAATFCGPDCQFLNPWSLPPTKAEVRLAGNVDEAEKAMHQIFGDQLQ